MRRTLHSQFVFMSLALLTACTQTRSPTSPSGLAPIGDIPPGAATLSSWAPQSQAAMVVDWACLTQGVGCPLMPAFAPPPAEDAPGPPANLAFQVSASTVVLTWSPPAGGGAVASYVLEAGTAAGQSNIVSFTTGSTATTFTATGVPNGTYFVRVRARNADGTSGPSNEVTIVVGGGGPCPTPSAPTGFTASASGNTVTLTWNTVAGAISFIIEAGSAPGAANIITFDTGSTATSFTGNAPNGTYHLRVRVRTACGISATSNEVVLTVGGSAPPPGGNFSGLWQGTVVVQEPSGTTTLQIQVDFTHSGTRLTGRVRDRGVTFDLNQTASNPRVFQGVLFNPTDRGGCQTKVGALTAQSSTRLTGRFSSTESCSVPHTNDIDVTKVQ